MTRAVMETTTERMTRQDDDDERRVRLKFQNADLTRLYDYWHERCRDGRLPLRGDIDPVDLGWMLDRISLFECHAGEGPGAPLRFRCRVAGTWYRQRFDFEANGSWLDSWPDIAMRDSVAAIYRLIHADGRARRVVRDCSVDDVSIAYEGAGLPLAAGAATDRGVPGPGGVPGAGGVAMILVGAAPVTEPDLTGLRLIHAAGPYRSWSS